MSYRGVTGRILRVSLALALAVMLLPGLALAAPGSGKSASAASSKKPAAASSKDYVDGQIIYRFKTGASVSQRSAARKSVGARGARKLGTVKGLEFASLPKGANVKAEVAALSAMPGVAYAQPNYIMRIAGAAPTPVYPTELGGPGVPTTTKQWPLNNLGDAGGVADADIDAPEAWGYTEGTSTVVVAVVDTGVDNTHPDLKSNMWVNTGETPNDNIDNDNNGYVDDVYGWNFVSYNNRVMDDNDHGTHVAGIIGASSNDGGVVGVSPRVKIMALKALDSNGSGTSASIVGALAYATARNVKIVNCSWGAQYEDAAITSQMAAAPDTLFVCAAGNSGVNIDTSATRFYPASSTLSNIIAVGASGSSDERALYSNVGASSVDVFAPGSAVKSAVAGADYLAQSAGKTIVMPTNTCDNLADWDTASVVPSAGTWETTSTVYHSSSASLAVMKYGNNADATAVLKAPINLVGKNSPYAEFWLGCSTQAVYDSVEWGIRDDSAGGVYISLGRQSGYASAFRHKVVDLSQFAGKSDLHFYVKFTSDPWYSYQNGYSAYLGTWVDDVRVVDFGTPPASDKSFSLDPDPRWDMVDTRAGDLWTYNSAEGSPTAGCYQIGTFPDGTGDRGGYRPYDNAWLFLDRVGGTWNTVADCSHSAKVLRFNAWYSTEPKYDFLEVWASPDPTFDLRSPGGDDVLLFRNDGDSGAVAGGAWQRMTVPITQFEGDPHVYIAFRFTSDQLFEYGGARIDQVRIDPFQYSAKDYADALALMSGTSMAAPHVSGIAALIRARNHTISATDTIAAIKAGAELKAGLTNLCVTNARVNALGALLNMNPEPVGVLDTYECVNNAPISVSAAKGVLLNDRDQLPNPTSMSVSDWWSPAKGSLTATASTGAFTYVPLAGYVGADKLAYTCQDSGAPSVAVSQKTYITMQVKAPNVPVADTLSCPKNSNDVSVNVLANDTKNLSSNTASLTQSPQHGTLQAYPTGIFTYKPNTAFVGTDTCTYCIKSVLAGSDNVVSTGSVTLTINVTNTAPVAIDHSYSVASGNVLTVPEATGVLAGATDANGDSLEATKVAGPSHGALTLKTDGSFTYTPTAGYSGPDSFTFTASDGDKPSAVKTASITVNAPPYAVIENDAPGVTFGRFINGFSPAYSGGSYTYAYSKAPYTGSRLEARFKGNKVRWIGPKNPAYGMAKVYIDGVYKATVDCYGASAVAKATLWESALLTDAVHTISIEMAAGKNPASSGYVVVIDRFEVEGTSPSGVGLRANETAGTFSGTWIKVANNPTYTGSSYAYSYWPPAKFKYTFTGTRCAWIGPKVVYYGRAAIYLDGVYKGTISQYAPATATSFRVRVWESPTLAKGIHTLEIRPLGSKDAAATGANIVVDAVDYIQ